jgi:hypothetical protein
MEANSGTNLAPMPLCVVTRVTEVSHPERVEAEPSVFESLP